jgi:CHAT domain-containing protein
VIRLSIASAPALLLAALLTTPLSAAPLTQDAAARLAGSFAAALQSDDPAEFAKLPLAERAYWRVIRDLFNAFRCFTIERVSASIEPAGELVRLHVHLDGFAENAGPPNAVRRLPAEWVLELVARDGRVEIEYAGTLENQLAREIAAERSTEAPDAVAARRDIDPVAFAKELAYEAAEPQFGTRTLPLIATARAIAASLGERRAESFIVEMYSSQQRFVGLYAEAVQTGDESVALGEELDDPNAIGGALFSRGLAQWSAGDLVAAIADLERAATYADRVLSPARVLTALHMANHLHALRGDVRSALAGAQKLLALSEQFHWGEGKAVASFSLGQAHAVLNNHAAAERYFLPALAWFESTGDPDRVAMGHFNIAICEAKLGRGGAAEARLRKALALGAALSGDQRAIIHLSIAELLLLRGALPEAQAALNDALAETSAQAAADVNDERLMSDLVLVQGELALRAGDPERALEDARKAAAAHKRPASIHGYWSPWRIASLAGKALARLKKHDEAAAQFEEAIAIIEAQWPALPIDAIAKTSYLGERTEPYYGLFDALLALGDRPVDALMAAERMRARVVREALEAERVDLHAHMTAAQRERERSLRQTTVELNRRLLAASNEEAPALRESLSAAREELRTFLVNVDASISDARRLQLDLPRELLASLEIPAGAVIVEYVVREQQTIAFVIARRGGRTDVKTRTIPIERKRLTTLATRFHTAVASEDLAFDEHARRLHDVLLAPLDDLLKEARTICIIPDDVLWQVPFQALRSRGGVYLIERASVFVSPSLAMLAESSRRNRDKAPRTLLAIAGAAGADGIALRQAETEVRQIASLYGRNRATIFAGKAATEDALRREAGRHSVLHVASHGLVDSASPRYSSVALGAPSNTPEDDGILELHEIVELRLAADLVVLSACETGRGELRPGEGPISLAWAFLAAGCPASVVSQWQVSTLAASELMIEFHRQLLAGRTNTEALRQAELKLLRTSRRSHPYYWAAFVVAGAGW